MRNLHVIAFIIVSCVIAAPAAAQNALVNPDFDSDLANWSDYGSFGTISHDPTIDRLDDAGSGSVRIENNTPSANCCMQLMGAWQCIPYTQGGANYIFSLNYLVASAQTAADLEIHAQVNFYGDAECSGPGLGGSSTYHGGGTPVALDFWNAIVSGQDIDQEAYSMAVVAQFRKDPSDESAFANFDDLTLTGPAVMFTTSFEAQTLALWSSTVNP